MDDVRGDPGFTHARIAVLQSYCKHDWSTLHRGGFVPRSDHGRPAYTVDAVDMDILKALAQDGRATYADIARRVDYNWRARIAVGAAVTSVIVADTMYNRMHDCLDDHGFDPDVRDWDAIWQQLHCHVFYQIGGGATWDLEGHRRSNWVGHLSLRNECNQ